MQIQSPNRFTPFGPYLVVCVAVKAKMHRQSFDFQCIFFLFLGSYFSSFSGAGGSRTLVQTCCKSAFYMFSLGLIVGNREVPDQPACRLSSKVSLPHRSLRSLACHFRYFGPDAGGRGFRRSTRNYGPCPCREIRGN